MPAVQQFAKLSSVGVLIFSLVVQHEAAALSLNNRTLAAYADRYAT